MNAFKVARKELLEMARDKRVRSALLMPIVMVYLMVNLFGFIESAAKSAMKQTIYYVKSENPISAALRGTGSTLKPVDSLKEGEKMIRSGKAGVVLDFGPPPVAGEQEIVNAYFDPQKDTSQIAVSAIEKAFEDASKKSLITVLREHGLPASTAEPIKVERKEIQVGKEGAGQLIVSLLPYLVILFAFVGGVSLASDLVAGEKEKNTLETLLITPVSRTEIVLGKFLALASVCLLSGLMALLGLVLASALQGPQMSAMFKGGLGLTPTSVGTIALLMVPLVAFFASILVAVSSYAKNSREAQTYLALVNVMVLLPAVFSQVIGLTDFGEKWWINMIPILNTANNIRNALMGRSDATGVAITIGVSLLLAAIALNVAIWLFNREEVLTRV